jgi:uracil phosphoribosyltransferase
MMLHILTKQPSIANHFLADLRDQERQKDRFRFRTQLEKLGEIFAYEISKLMRYEPIDIETPLGIASTRLCPEQPVIAGVLRAGLPLQQGLLRFFDQADTAFVGIYRNVKKSGSFELFNQYQSTPPLEGRTLIIADTIIATGRSVVRAAKDLLNEQTPYQIHIVAALASEEGLTHVRAHLPKAHIWVGDMDQELTSKAYVVPGLGDAGDLAFGPTSS